MDDRSTNVRPDGAGPDDRLLELLAGVLDDADGPPDAIVDQAAALIVLRDLDAELLELLSDTRTMEGELVTRAEQLDWRLVVFRGSAFSVTLEISNDTGEAAVIGHIDPAGPHEVELLISGAERSAALQTEDGRFSVPGPLVPFQVLITLPDGRRGVTPLIDV
jgi:hypothetical protein